MGGHTGVRASQTVGVCPHSGAFLGLAWEKGLILKVAVKIAVFVHFFRYSSRQNVKNAICRPLPPGTVQKMPFFLLFFRGQGKKWHWEPSRYENTDKNAVWSLVFSGTTEKMPFAGLFFPGER